MKATRIVVPAAVAAAVATGLAAGPASVASAAPTPEQIGVIDLIAGRMDLPQLFAGDGGPATNARLSGVRDVEHAKDGSVYISDLNNGRIRKISPNGIISTIAGSGTLGFSGDGGQATRARLNLNHSITLTPDESALIICDSGNGAVRKVDFATGIITTIAGRGKNGPADILAWPAGVSYLADGSLLIADHTGATVRKLAPNGAYTVFAGNAHQGDTGDGGQATSARINYPRGTVEGPDGSVYIAEEFGNRIRKVAPNGVITTFAGTGVAGFGGDGGRAINARFSDVRDLEIADDYMYVAERYNADVRRIDMRTNIITTIAGTGGQVGYIGDDIPATSALIGWARGIDVEDGFLYIASEDARYPGTNQERSGIFRVGLADRPAPPPPPPAGAVSTYIAENSTWKYNDTGANLGTGWRATDFNDTAWKSGAAEIGYGENDEKTKITAGRYTYYLRQSFDAGNIDGVTGLLIRANVDDGAAIYLNGVELSRYNLPAGNLTYTTKASTAVGGSDENKWISFAVVPVGLLQAGQNTLAVEVHNDSSSSSDISFNLELKPQR